MLQLNLTNAIKELKKKKFRKVFLQVPEGLKTRVEEIINELEKNGLIVVSTMDACFGACDIKPIKAKKMGCEVILHLGHTKFVEKTILPIIYVPLKYDLGEKISKIIEVLVEYLKGEKIDSIGLTTTAQYLSYLPLIKKELMKHKISGVIGKGKRVEDGQVLGCNYSSAIIKPINILYFGDGLFHPLGIHYATKKNVVLMNPITLEISELDEEKNRFLTQRILLIERAKTANSYAILVSTKEGQNKISEAQKIRKKLEANKKKASVYSMDFVSQESLLGINAEAFINTACPRISIDDYLNYNKPIINFTEVKYMLGEKDYEEYALETIY